MINRNKDIMNFTEYCILYGHRYFMKEYYDTLFTQIQYGDESQLEEITNELVDNINSFVKADYHNVAKDMEERLYLAYDRRR